jgi:hypothetical protein
MEEVEEVVISKLVHGGQGFGVFVWVRPEASGLECFSALVKVVVASGVATMIAYGVDALAELKGRAAIAPRE